MQGEGKPGRSTKYEESLMLFKDEAIIKFSAELCLNTNTDNNNNDK